MSTEEQQRVAEVEKQMKAARRSRGGHRAYATKIIKESESLLLDRSGDAVTRKTDLRTNAALLEGKLKELRIWDEKITELLEDDDAFNQEFIDTGDYNRTITRVLVGIKEELMEDVKPTSPSTPLDSKPVPKSSSQKSAKLPRIEVPSFDGDPLRFRTFWDTFECMIDKDDTLDEQMKFTYLRAKMEGKAKLALEGLTLTKDNYKEAVKLLHERFGDEQIMIQSHMDALLALSPVEENRIDELRKLCDIIEVHIRNLQSFKISVENYGPVLISIIVSKLPREINLEISRQMPAQGKWEIVQLMEAVKKEVAARERCHVRENPGSDSSSTMTLPSDHKGVNQRRDKFRKKGKELCVFCGKGGHQPSACRSVVSVETRKAIVRKERRCYICLIQNHTAEKCSKRSSNSCSKCNGKHHDALCDRNPTANDDNANGDGGGDNNDDAVNLVNLSEDHHIVSNNVVNTNNCVLLQTARAEILNDGNNAIEARVIFDNCSQRSFISSNLRDQLKLPTLRRGMLNLKPFGVEKTKIHKTDIVSVAVRNRRHQNIVQKIDCFVVPLICAPVSGQCIDLVKDKYPQLQDIELADDNCKSTNLDVDILIGADFINHFVSSKQRKIEGGLVATNTLLGWVLNGGVRNEITQQQQSVNLTTVSHVLEVQGEVFDPVIPPESTVKEELRKFWEIDGSGDENENTCFDREEFKTKITFKEGRYSVPLPFLEGAEESLPLNHYLSEKRLESMTRKLKSNPELFKRYDDVIKTQETDGKIERVYDDPPQGSAHYLPHHGVLDEDRETTKLRVVYDASSGVPSLNASLDKGENLIPPLVDVLLRSRLFKIAVFSDIKQAFLSVSVDEEFRDFLRFLWYDDINATEFETIVYRFTRVLFGVNASLWLLLIVIRRHLEQYREADPELIAYVLRSLYVDDVIGGADKSDVAFDNYRKLKHIFAAAGLELRKWCSNDVDLHQRINACESNDETGNNAIEVNTATKVLGVPLDLIADEFHIKTEKIYRAGQQIVITKCNVSRVINSIFDPTGIIAIIVISFKVFFQRIVQLKCNWKAELPPDFQIEWIKLLELLRDDSMFRVPRYYFGPHSLSDFKEFIIHGFCDASDIAYAAVIYIVAVTDDGQRISSFVRASPKVAPIKKISTPRLELCACLLLSELLVNVIKAMQENIQFSSTVCWSDSLDALFWIKNEKKRRKVFVENRVKKIRKKVSALNWRHCPSELNPADIASRGVKQPSRVTTEFRKIIDGPELLRQPSDVWPDDLSKDGGSERVVTDGVNSITVNYTSESNIEVVCLYLTDEVTEKPTQKVKVYSNRIRIDENITIENYSCLWKLLRVTAWVIRFASNLQRSRRGESLTTGYLKVHEITEAERKWIISVQHSLESKTKQLNNTLGLYLDSTGVLLCKGRLNNAELTAHQKNPILIPGSSYFARLLVMDAHQRTAHGGKKDTIVQLRSRFWVTKGRKLVRHVLHGCAHPCKRLEGKAFKSVESSQLPSFRVCQSFPFTNTGVDYLGPLLVRQVYDDSNSTEMYKTWVVLYTCAVTRAVHLDLVPDLSASAFLRSLDRFMYRRVVPNLMISDNATCFKNEEVKLNEELLRLRVKWQFIVEASPWWGGFWERLVQSVKRCMRKILFRASVNYEELLTVIARVEGILNSRPLTYDNEEEEPLTPSHLLTGHRLLSTFEEEPFNEDINVTNVMITKRMRYLRDLSDKYWKRFTDEYLLELRSQHIQGSDPVRTPDVGEVVVIEGTKKRNDWRLGKIISLIRGRDGRNRGATIKTFDGSDSRYIRRPIERLYPIEVQSTVSVSDEEIAEASVSSSDNLSSYTEHTERPSRIAGDNGIIARRLAGHV